MNIIMYILLRYFKKLYNYYSDTTASIFHYEPLCINYVIHVLMFIIS